MEIQKIFSNVENPEEALYSVLMTEDEMDIYQSLFSDKEEYEGLNYDDLIANTGIKNPFTIKKLREAKAEHLSKEKGKGKLTSAVRGAGAGLVGAVGGAALGKLKGGKSGAVLGALAGLTGGSAAGYYGDRGLRALRNKVRRSGGGGKIDDMYAREADRYAMVDGKMSRADFKKKWYRNNGAQ